MTTSIDTAQANLSIAISKRDDAQRSFLAQLAGSEVTPTSAMIRHAEAAKAAFADAEQAVTDAQADLTTAAEAAS
jgi:hypothetical protein